MSTVNPGTPPQFLIVEVNILLSLFFAVGRKRQHEQEDSPSPSIASVSKRFCEASRVPTSVIIVRRKVEEQKRTGKLAPNAVYFVLQKIHSYHTRDLSIINVSIPYI